MSTSTQINGGSVEYTSPSNYNTGKDGIKAVVFYSVADGADRGTWQAIGDEARREAVRLVRGPAGVPVPPTMTVAEQPASAATDAAPGSSTPARTAAASPSSSATHGPIATTAASPSEPVPTQAAPASPLSALAATGPATPASTPSPASVEITDAQILEHVQHHNSRLLNAAGTDVVKKQTAAGLVPRLLAEYVTPPQKMFHIPQDKRPEFVKRLEELR